MSSIRRIKKQIRYACGDLSVELLMASYALDGFDTSKTAEIMGDIASLQVDALKKCTFAFDKVRADYSDDAAYRKARHSYNKAAFDKLRAEINERLKAIVKEMNAALPASAKTANKA